MSTICIIQDVCNTKSIPQRDEQNIKRIENAFTITHKKIAHKNVLRAAQNPPRPILSVGKFDIFNFKHLGEVHTHLNDVNIPEKSIPGVNEYLNIIFKGY